MPHGATWADISPLWTVFLSYCLSFVYVGIFWNNHHHLLHSASSVTGTILWANLHLLFWLSLMPFATGWMGENHFAALPTAVYGTVLLMSSVAYRLLQQRIIASQGESSELALALGKDWKGKLPPLLYLVAIVSAFWLPQVAHCVYVGVAMMWFIPDRRIERTISKDRP